MKRFLACILSIGMAVSLMACGGSSGSSAQATTAATQTEAAKGFDKMTLKMNIVVSDTTTWYKAATKFADTVKEATDGAVTVELYPNCQLSGGSQPKAIEMLMSGSIDMDMTSGMIFNNLDERFCAMNLPFLYSSTEEAEKIASTTGREVFSGMLDEKGIHLLGLGENGWRQLTNNVKEIKAPADMNGLKFRTPGVTLYIDTFTALGANPVSMNWSETFTALQQGTVDGQENPTDISKSSAIQEVQKYLTIWNYSYDPFFFSINKAKWDSFSPELQEIFSTAADEALAYQWTLVEEADAQAAKDFEAAGAKVTVLTDEEREAFKEATQEVVDSYKAKWGDEFMSNFIPK